MAGADPRHVRASDAEVLRPRESGIHFRTHERGLLFNCGALFRTNRECTSFMLPNGGYAQSGQAEFSDYAIRTMSSEDVSR